MHTRAAAQTLDVLNAERTSSYIYLVMEPSPNDGKKTFTYALDGHGGRDVRTSVLPGTTLAGSRSKGVNVVMRFLNPLRYSWTVSETAKDDPTLLAVRKFLGAATGFFELIDAQTAKSATVAERPVQALSKEPVPKRAPDTPKGTAGKAIETVTAPAPLERKMAVAKLEKGKARTGGDTTTAPPDTLLVPPIFAPALRDWSQWLTQQQKCFADSQEASAFIGAVRSADHQLYGIAAVEPVGAPTAESFRNAVVHTLKALRDANTISQLRTVTTQTSDTLELILQLNKSVRAVLGGVKAPAKWTDAPGCYNFGLYTAQALDAFRGEATTLLDGRDRLATDLGALNDKVASLLLPSMNADGDQEYFTIGNIAIPQGKQKEVTITIHERSIELKDAAVKISELGDVVTSFHVLEHQAMLFEFAPGLAYVNIHYPKFSTTDVDGKTVVASAGADTQGASAVAMLNITPNIGWGGISRLIGQIGVGSGKQYPLLLFGGGIRLTDSTGFTLTVGGALAWRQMLNALKPGDPVSGMADVEKDLGYKLNSRPQIYIGLQRGLQ